MTAGSIRVAFGWGPRVAGLFLACAAGAGEIAADGLDALPAADVVVLGEVHDNPAHHLNQARAVRAVAAKALVFEMFGPEAALRAAPALRGDAGALARALDWEAGGWPQFTHYYPIFEAAPGAALFGGGLPQGEVRRAVTEGAAAVLGAGAPVFGLDAPLGTEEQAAREALQDEAHCGALPKAVLPGMVEAQRLRDAALARAVVAAMAETGGPVAVITGNGHARTDWGVPALLALALPDAEVLSLGQFEAAPDQEPPHDLWLVTDPAERDDPCAGLR